MIIGTGIDIIEVARVAEKVNKESGFRQKVFSNSEVQFCESRNDKSQSYAGRFAAKEAFLKATGKGLALGFELRDIEIINDSAGKPEIMLRGNFQQLAADNGWNKIHLSLSHLQHIACAVVILET